MTLRVLAALVFLPFLSFSQNIPPRYSASTGTLTLSGAGTSFTLQQKAGGGKQISLEVAVISCSVACTVTQAQNGTAASTTASTVVPIEPNNTTGTATVWTSSNVGAGTSVPGPLPVPAAGVVVLDLSKVYFAKTSTNTTNYTIIISSISGTASITYYWSE